METMINPKVFVSVVSIKPEYVSFLWTLRMLDFASGSGIEAELMPRLDESLLCRARQRALADFFYATDYTHLMTVDDDLLLPEDALVKMIEADKDIIGGFYRLKSEQYIGSCVRTKHEPWYHVLLDKRLEEAEYVSTGCMLVKREVVVDMINAFPQLEYRENLDQRLLWALYQPFVFHNGIFNEYLSEDWAFCERAKQIGYSIWAHGDVQCHHIGKTFYTFKGLQDDRVDPRSNQAKDE